MIGAKVNGKLVTIDYVIQNGDRIEIITSQNSRGPSRDWLNIVKSTQAKNKINQWFRSELKEENILRGKELIAQCCKSKGINLSDINKPEYQHKILNKYGFHDWNSALATVGHGGLKESQIVNRMYEEYKKDHVTQLTDQDVLVLLQKIIKRKPFLQNQKVGSSSRDYMMLQSFFKMLQPLYPEMRSSDLSQEGVVCRSTVQTVSTLSIFPRWKKCV